MDPAIIERKALGLSFFFSGALSCCAVAIVEGVVVVLVELGNFEAMTEIEFEVPCDAAALAGANKVLDFETLGRNFKT